MARGKSGRIVIEVEPELKNELYASLAHSGKTLKDWFVGAAEEYCEDIRQPVLFQTEARQKKGLKANEPAKA